MDKLDKFREQSLERARRLDRGELLRKLADAEDKYGCGVGGGLVESVRRATARRCAEIADAHVAACRAARQHSGSAELIRNAIRREFEVED